MSHTPPDKSPEPYEPHYNNFIRDRRKMRDQYGPYAYTRGMYVNGSKTPLKPRNIRIQSSIPIVFAVALTAFGIWFLADGRDPSGAFLVFGFSIVCLFLSWIGFRTARIREKWERENPERAKNIHY
jgi:hypothetical protein